MILPLIRETVVLADPPEVVKEKLSLGIRRGKSVHKKPMDDNRKFMGKMENDYFNITRILERPENFMPQVEGNIEKAGEGSIIFLKFTLQFSSRMFVIFWSVTAFFFALFLWYIQSELWLGLIAIGALLLNLLITHLNFRRKMKVTRNILLQILES